MELKRIRLTDNELRCIVVKCAQCGKNPCPSNCPTLKEVAK